MSVGKMSRAAEARQRFFEKMGKELDDYLVEVTAEIVAGLAVQVPEDAEESLARAYFCGSGLEGEPFAIRLMERITELRAALGATREMYSINDKDLERLEQAATRRGKALRMLREAAKRALDVAVKQDERRAGELHTHPVRGNEHVVGCGVCDRESSLVELRDALDATAGLAV